jgi:cellulose synthase (UDP-forming)
LAWDFITVRVFVAWPCGLYGMHFQKRFSAMMGSATKVFEARPLKTTSAAFLVPVMTRRQKCIYLVLLALWAIALVYLWLWWFKTEHVLSWVDVAFVSLLLGWQTLLPAYYFYFVYRMKRPNPAIDIPRQWRVAMVVTKAPSEPWPVVRQTLEAMLSQDCPHDNWLADEDPAEETIAWCKAMGVKLSCRKGVAAYHRATWPRRTRCKEGNLAYFYDHYGYDRYDIVVQLDADHIPEPGYLEAMLRPFVNPLVGYVAAPSICDANAEESWVVNARAYVEASMHGSLQAGYNDGWAPLCIGSHYAVRTAALKEIGGLGPELAEDHSTTLLMNTHGWRGIFAFDAIAHGHGPACFSDFLVQEYQWARSLTTLLLTLTPQCWSFLNRRLKFQFAFAQLWYPLYALSLAVGLSLPLIALLRDVPWLNMSYADFLWRSLLVDMAALAIIVWISRNTWFRPANAKVMSWETILFQIVRWPWVLAGVINATLAWSIDQELPFRVTPKGDTGPKPLPIRVLMPYLLMAVASALVVVAVHQVSYTHGYYFLALLNGGIYALAAIAVILVHIGENRRYLKRYLPQTMVGVLALGLIATASVVRGGSAWEGIVAGSRVGNNTVPTSLIEANPPQPLSPKGLRD